MPHFETLVCLLLGQPALNKSSSLPRFVSRIHWPVECSEQSEPRLSNKATPAVLAKWYGSWFLLLLHLLYNLFLCETSFFFLLKVTLLSLFCFLLAAQVLTCSCADLGSLSMVFIKISIRVNHSAFQLRLIREFGCLWIDFHRF